MAEQITASKLSDLKANGVTYDTALPQYWYNKFYELTGENPRGLYVWGYTSVLGQPIRVIPEK